MDKLFKIQDEIEKEIQKLKEIIVTATDVIEQLGVPYFGVNYMEIYELYENLLGCLNHNPHPKTQSAGNLTKLLKPDMTGNPPLLALETSKNYLRQVHDFLLELEIEMNNLNVDLPFEARKTKVKQIRQKTFIADQPIIIDMLKSDNGVETASRVEISYPVQPTLPTQQKSIDRNLLGDDFVPFNKDIPDQSNSVLPGTSSKDITIIPRIVVHEPHTTLNDKPGYCGTEAVQSATDIDIICRNISEHGMNSVIDTQNMVAPEIESIVNIQHEPPSLLLNTEQTSIDQNAVELIQEIQNEKSLNVQRMSRLQNTKTSLHTASNSTAASEPIQIKKPIHLKRIKFIQIENDIVLIPVTADKFKISPHQRVDCFISDIHTKKMIIAMLELRKDNWIPQEQASIQQVESTEIPVAVVQPNEQSKTPMPHSKPATQPIIPPIHPKQPNKPDQPISPLIHQSQMEVQLPQPDRDEHVNKSIELPVVPPFAEQSENPLQSANNTTDKLSSFAQLSHALPALHISLPLPFDTDKRPDTPYTCFKNVLENKPGTKIKDQNQLHDYHLKNFTSATFGTSALPTEFEEEMIGKLHHDQYEALYTFQLIQRKNNLSPKISLSSLRAHFGEDCIAYCKQIRMAIDLQCYKLVNIVKVGTKIENIEIRVRRALDI